ncbi:MAG: AAA family ATPase [Muribaculaceae bacterium]|nr:AAA family ATPase [Muribaculaceae bacterium]
MKCSKCNRDNRDTAKFCKWCGTAILSRVSAPPAQDKSKDDGTKSLAGGSLDNLIEKEDIVRKLGSIIAKAKGKADYCRKNGIKERMQLSFVITGDPGSGKTETAYTIAQMLYEAGVTRSPEPVVVNAVNFNEWKKDVGKHEAKYANSVIIFEESQKLIGDGEHTDINDIDHLLQLVKRWREKGDMPVAIITGGRELLKYLREHGSATIINYFFETNSPTLEGLKLIAEHKLRNKFMRTLTPEASDKLGRVLLYDFRNPNEAPGAGGHMAAERAYQIDLNAVEKGVFVNPLGPEFISGTEYRPKTFEEVMEDFDRFVGIDNIKKAVKTIANGIAVDVAAGREPTVTKHFRFIGNPGTGKTTMARLFADALNALGALPVGQFVEVSKNDLVSSYVGGTTEKVTSVFKKAMGGVLFIDEAYQLANDSHGKDAIDTILTLTENNRGKIVVILAGYAKEMNELNSLNTGVASRFKETIDFPDYDAATLLAIFRSMIKHSPDGLTLSEDAEKGVENFFKLMYQGRKENFGNAREVRNVFDTAVERMRNRVADDPSQPREITMSDIEGEEVSRPKTIEEILAALDDMVGMDKVKEQLITIASDVRLRRMQMEFGDDSPELMNIHIAITGNPGTGKTEVAKRLGQIFRAIGVADKGHVVMRERKTLLDSMVNSAGINMDKAVNEALGGILFIDEAYNLIPMDNPSQKDSDGMAAVEALMTRMVNDAGKFITVIAGYKQEIEEFIANANPGLKSRFTHRIHIDDYTPGQLFEIFMRAAAKSKLKLTDDACELLQKKIDEMVTMKDRKFGNARDVLKLLNETRARMSTRLREAVMSGKVTKEQLFTIEAPDIPYEAPKRVNIKETFRKLDELVGLESVKTVVRDIADAIIVEQERARLEDRRPSIPLDSYLFLGNPGTGKTTVARLMAEIFYSLGLLPSNKLIEIKPGDLIAGFVGQTAPKTRQMAQRGIGGVLFIDEAYGLKDGGFGEKDATPELLTILADNKDKMVCIAAGYPYEISEWLACNTGLPRRFTRTINFEDYNEDDLARIFINIAKKNGMRLDEDADAEMRRYFSDLVANKGDGFGNAAEAVNYFNKVKINQGARLRKEMTPDGFRREDLYVLKFDDMQLR